MVPVVDLSRRGARFAEEFGAVVQRIAAGGRFLLGDELVHFEDAFAGATGARHAVGVSSGAGALQLGLAALGVGPGDEVIVPAFTAFPTASSVSAVGATPVFVDVEDDTACLDRELVAAAVTDRTKAVIVVHLYGYPAELPDVTVPVVEDAAQAHGALTDTSRSACTAYSFYPTKNLGGIGDGGAVVTDDAQLAERVRLRRVHGMGERYEHHAVSQNFRMSEIEAAWLNLALPALDGDVERRRTIARTYRQAAPGLRWASDDDRHAFHLCVFRADDREEAIAGLADAGVATAVHYRVSLPDQPAYGTLGGPPCPVARAWAQECVSVPCFPEMTATEVGRVAEALAGLPT